MLAGAPAAVQTHGTTVDGRKVTPNKPLHLHNGVCLQFGSLVPRYFVKCDDSGALHAQGTGYSDASDSSAVPWYLLMCLSPEHGNLTRKVLVEALIY